VSVSVIPSPRAASGESSAASRNVVIDTGPLLCFGHVSGGVRLLLSRYHGRLRWTEAVAKEVKAHASIQVRSDIDRQRRAAASRWVGPSAAGLGPPHEFKERPPVETIRVLVQSASRKPPGKKSSGGKGDLGESETLLLAQREQAYALINEDAARRVAPRLRVTAHCTLDVLIAEFKDGRLAPRKLQQMYEQLRAADLDPGEFLPHPYRVRNLESWPSAGPA
jgi:hypothetical protein